MENSDSGWLVAEALAKENDRLRKALKIADDSIRHHLRSDEIAAAIIQPHAVKAIREALKGGDALDTGTR